MMVPSATMAIDVSSQLVSMPRMRDILPMTFFLLRARVCCLLHWQGLLEDSPPLQELHRALELEVLLRRWDAREAFGFWWLALGFTLRLLLLFLFVQGIGQVFFANHLAWCLRSLRLLDRLVLHLDIGGDALPL